MQYDRLDIDVCLSQLVKMIVSSLKIKIKIMMVLYPP